MVEVVCGLRELVSVLVLSDHDQHLGSDDEDVCLVLLLSSPIQYSHRTVGNCRILRIAVLNVKTLWPFIAACHIIELTSSLLPVFLSSCFAPELFSPL